MHIGAVACIRYRAILNELELLDEVAKKLCTQATMLAAQLAWITSFGYFLQVLEIIHLEYVCKRDMCIL